MQRITYLRLYTLMCVFLATTGFLRAQLSVVANAGLPNVGRGQIKFADFNNDGNLDALVVGQTSAYATVTASTATIGLYLGNGNGQFTIAPSTWFPTAPTAVNAGMMALADFDRDGNIDFCYAGQTEAGANVIYLYRNTGTTFVNYTTSAFTGTTAPTGCYSGSIQWGDIDNDGDLDLMVSGRTYSTLSYPTSTGYRINVFMIYKNNGNGTFTQSVSNTSLGVCYGQALFVDLENDGDLDIYYSGGGSSAAAGYMINDGTGVYGATVSSNTTRGTNMIIGDFNKDGIADVLQSCITGSTSPYVLNLRMLYNASSNGVISQNVVSYNPVYGAGANAFTTNVGVVSAIDYNADGNLDYTNQGLNSSSVPTTSLFLNNGLTATPTFTDAALNLTGLHYGGAEWADLNGDGKPDFVIFGYSDATASTPATVVYLNNSTANTAPTAPTSLTSTSSSGNLAWVMPASADDHTPNINLTYNVRIGTTPGSSDIMKASVYGPGKYTRPSAAMRGLADGTYYWSVQAVDGANVAGAWSSESTLIISNPTAVPTTQASNLTTSAVTATSLNVAWTNGDGYKTAVFVKAGSNASDLPSPVNNTKYLANPLYASGTQIGTSGWYCVYNDAVTPSSVGAVDVYGLAAQTSYQVVAISYNSDAAYTTINYLATAGTNNPVVVTTTDFTVPTILTSALTVTANATGSSVGITPSQSGTTGWDNSYATVVFIKSGNDANEDVPLVANTTYTANASATNTGNFVGASTWHCVYKGNSTYVGNGAFAQLPFITGLTANSTYQVRACTYNGTAGKEKYSQTTGIVFTTNVTNAPSVQAKNFAASAITQTSFTLDWLNGNGYKTAIFVKAGSNVSDLATPVTNTVYSANPVYKSGAQIGTSGWYCVYNNVVTPSSTGSMTVTGLNPSTSYQVMAISYNSDPSYSTINYLTTAGSAANPLIASTIDYSTPTILTSALTVTSNITGTSVGITPSQSGTTGWDAPYATVVFMKEGINASEDVPLSSNVTYTANASFMTSGTQVGTSGWYCVYNGNTTYLGNGIFGEFNLFTGLTANTSYQVRACTYNGIAGFEKYSTTAGTVLTTPINNVTRIANSTTDAVKVYPTINKGQVNIEGSNVECVEFHTVTGLLVKRIHLTQAKNVLNISDLTNGTYLFKIRLSDGSQKTGNIILQK